jgi:glyoxylase I family protein
MRILGITFAGTSTAARPEMAAFLRDVLGLTPAHVEGVEADLFQLPDGSSFAVASPEGMGQTERSLGFLVDDIDGAVRELAAAGADVESQIASNARQRYTHFRAPDGHVYELVQNLTA